MKLKTLVTELKRKGYQSVVDRTDNILTVKKLVSDDVSDKTVAMLSIDGFTINTEFDLFRKLSEVERTFLTDSLLGFIQTNLKDREIISYYSLKVNWLTGVKVKYLGYADNQRVYITEGKCSHEEKDIVSLKRDKNVPVESMTLVDSLNNREFEPTTWFIENEKIVYLDNNGNSLGNEVII